MAHDHSSHSHGSGHHHGTGNIKVAFFLNVVFTIIEIVGGILTNSVAILSDAIHDLGDSLSLGLAWYFQNVSKKEATPKYSYGFRRFSLLGAIINSIVLVVGSIFIVVEAIPRLINPVTPDAKGMIILGILGVIFNGAAVLRLKKGTSLNERVVSLHLMEDVLGWVAVLIGAILMYFFDIPIIDPILSLGIALFILFNVYKNLKETVQIVMQGTPDGIDVEDVKHHLLEVSAISAVHDLHVWSMDGEFTVLSAHLVLKDFASVQEMSAIKMEVRTILRELGIDHPTLEFEFVVGISRREEMDH